MVRSFKRGFPFADSSMAWYFVLPENGFVLSSALCEIISPRALPHFIFTTPFLSFNSMNILPGQTNQWPASCLLRTEGQTLSWGKLLISFTGMYHLAWLKFKHFFGNLIEKQKPTCEKILREVANSRYLWKARNLPKRLYHKEIRINNELLVFDLCPKTGESCGVIFSLALFAKKTW